MSDVAPAPQVAPEASADPAIVATGLTRRFGATPALNGYEVALPKGEVIALVGPNGAGKTTLLLILAGLLAPDSGTVRIGGFDPVHNAFEVHRVVGWMPDFFGTYDDLTAREYLELFAAAFNVERGARTTRARELLALVGLEAKADQPVHTLSRGQKQRLGFARTIVHSPRILLLDEPASGLDPRARIDLRNLVRRQREDGVTVVISSHILGELEEMSDVVAFVDAGRSRGVYPLSGLPSSQTTMRWKIRALDGLEDALARSQVSWEAVAPGRAVVDATSDEAAADLLSQLVSQGVRVVEMTPIGGGLEGAFLAMDQESAP